ncbi:MAG TPA: molybdopterin-dependent oxidoreductase [Anaerolineaceae bacterium]
MSEKISRRNFLKVGGLGAAAAAVLTGCGPATRYVTRRPYAEMPEYNQTGLSTYYATTCRECPAGCGLIIRTLEGRALKAEGNPNHPVNRGKICSLGLTSIQGLYNPDRITSPRRVLKRGTVGSERITWEAAIAVVSAALKDTAPSEMAFLLGATPDHLFDLVSEMASAAGAPSPLRAGAYSMFHASATLIEACKRVFGKPGYPLFDIAKADLVLDFGSDFLSTWLSPVAYSKAYGDLRKGIEGKRGYLISFEPRQSLTAGSADEWYPVAPGTEGLVALALGQLISKARGKIHPAYAGIDPAAAAGTAGVSLEKLQQIANKAANSRMVALPGGEALNHGNGLATARAILCLNLVARSANLAGGASLSPAGTIVSSGREIQALIQRMNEGKVKTLFIHGNNPVFELPQTLGFTQALAKVPLVISFGSFPDETSLYADYILPDHSPLESFGYQRVIPAADRAMIASIQPVVAPLHDTRATADVLLAAAKAAGSRYTKITYTDEVDFIQAKLLPYLNRKEGSIIAAEIPSFWAKFLQYGGWWQNLPAPASIALEMPEEALKISPPTPLPEGKLHLAIYMNHFGDGSSANRPWIQETPDPLTTVTWSNFVLIHPKTAEKLGLHDDDVVRLDTGAGNSEVAVYTFPAIRPDTVAIPFGQGHSSLGRFANGRGTNPFNLIEASYTEAGDLVLGDTIVSITHTSRKHPLARVESRAGVYGKH